MGWPEPASGASLPERKQLRNGDGEVGTPWNQWNPSLSDRHMVDHFADTALTPRTDAHIPCVLLKLWWLGASGARLSKAFAACKSTQASWDEHDEHVNICWIFLNILEISTSDFNRFLTRLEIRDEDLKDHHIGFIWISKASSRDHGRVDWVDSSAMAGRGPAVFANRMDQALWKSRERSSAGEDAAGIAMVNLTRVSLVACWSCWNLVSDGVRWCQMIVRWCQVSIQITIRHNGR